MLAKIVVLVNDTPYGVMALRARNITRPLNGAYDIRIFYREGGRLESLRRFMRVVRQEKPDLLYVMNIAYAGGGAALLFKTLQGIPFILDHGDPVVEILRNMGRRYWGEYPLAWVTERLMLRVADAVIVRGYYLAELVRKNCVRPVYFIPDGVDTALFRPMDVSALRKDLGLVDVLTLGVVGSIVWSEKYAICYGWDVVETLHLLRDEPVWGIIVGDGSGLEKLKQKVANYGIQDRILFTGRVDHAEVPRYLNLMDICLSTQTNDLVGACRTTAKLPEYLACGRFVIATDVGGARQLIKENGILLPYQGIKDTTYPERLAGEVRSILHNPARLARGMDGVEMAKQYFEYASLARRFEEVVEVVIR